MASEKAGMMVEGFGEHRALLFGIAYRMLGSVAEAEDLVQETFLRWQGQNAAAIESPKAWLVATVTRLGIDQLRSARRRREQYVGVWLPEPIVDEAAAAPDRAAAVADSLGMAFLVMLEALGPVERAVFLLREAFVYDYAEIAQIVGKSEANCRQIFSRAKAQLSASGTPPRASAQAEEIARRFMGACATGNLQELLTVLTEDAVLYSDSGGKVRAARRPILSADRISRFYVGIHQRAFAGTRLSLVQVNGEVGVLHRRRDGLVGVSAFAFSAERIRAIYTVMNPEKLTRVAVRTFDGG